MLKEKTITIPKIDLKFRSAAESQAAGEAFRFAIQVLSQSLDVYVSREPQFIYDKDGFRTVVEFTAAEPEVTGSPVIRKVERSPHVVTWMPAQPRTRHVMLDLETLGRRPGCPVISIGAVEMTPVGLGEEFYRNLAVEEQVAHGLKIDPDTQEWWSEQSDDARKALSENVGPAPVVLTDFANWLRQFGDKVCVWGNGANFDQPVLVAAYEAFAWTAPWQFYNDRCYRTLKNLYKSIRIGDRQGPEHHALYDAKAQAEHAIRILNEHDLWATV